MNILKMKPTDKFSIKFTTGYNEESESDENFKLPEPDHLKAVMMKFVRKTTAPHGIPTQASLTPIMVDGARDLGRPMMFIGQTQLMSQMGPLPVQAPIEAQNLADAIAAFPDAIKIAIEAMVEEAKELQRQEMSRIVVPGAETTSKIIGPK